MSFWDSLKFGARVMLLERTAELPRATIERFQRRRLKSLVRHVRAKSEFYRQKYAGVDESSFELADLPTTNKSEIMDNFDRVVTVDDVRRADLEHFFADAGNLARCSETSTP